MTILQAYLWGVLVTWICVSGEDPSADGNVAGIVSVLWFVAIPYAIGCGVKSYLPEEEKR